ncbi:MAG: ATP-binding protein [Patescibacteria group bacterium]|nr:ATP-binding protein [Patescibacteria group bacterium]
MSFLPKKNPSIPSLTHELPPQTEPVADIIAPSSIETDFNNIRVGEMFYKTLFVIGYPRFVSINWLQPLIDFEHEIRTSFFIYPVVASDVLTDLQRKIAEMEATIASDEDQGRVVNPRVTAALDDALEVQQSLAKGVERFFQLGLYITIAGKSIDELETITRQLTTTLSSLLMSVKTATLQMEGGFKTTLPMAQDKVFITRNMDSTSLASMFPFVSATLTQNKGILYGINEMNGSLVVFDRFSLENANEIVFGKSGSGKSYTIKLEILRSYMFGTEVIVIDPENEYQQVAKTLNGEYVVFSHTSPIKINPFDLSGLYEEGENELGQKILSLHALLKIALGELTPSQDAILDRALIETYQGKGITHEPATQTKEPPIMTDLYNVLLGMKEPEAQELALRMEKFIKGSMAGIFNEQSNFNINNQLTIFSMSQIEDEVRPIAMHIILDFVWTKIRKTLKRRLLIVDEAWYVMQYEDSASFIFGIAKRARKYYLGLTTATQDVEDFLSTSYGKAILSNSSLQILLKQSTSSIDIVADTFYLSAGEKQMLMSANVGEGLFFAGQNHVAMQVVSAPFEHEIITSNPEEMLARKQQHEREMAVENQTNVATPADEHPTSAS